MGRAALTILGKDLRLRLRDRSVWMFALVVPLGLTFLFAQILPMADEEPEISAGLVDLDQGPAAAAFSDGVLAGLVDAGVVTSTEQHDLDTAAAAIERGELDVVWVLPAGLSDVIGGSTTPPIEVLVAEGRGLAGEVGRAVAETFAQRTSVVALAVASAARTDDAGADARDVARLAAAAGSIEGLVGITRPDLGVGEPLDPVSYLAAGMAAFFAFFVVQFGVTGLLEERELGTLSRLQAAPIAPGAVPAAKMAAAGLLGIVSMAVVMTSSAVLLDARWGPWPGVALLVLALVVAAVGLMRLVGAFARTAEQAGNHQAAIAVVLGLAGGVFFPVPGDSPLMDLATQASPHGWFLRGLADLAVAQRWTVVLPAAAVIAGIGLVAVVPAAIVERRRLGR